MNNIDEGAPFFSLNFHSKIHSERSIAAGVMRWYNTVKAALLDYVKEIYCTIKRTTSKKKKNQKRIALFSTTSIILLELLISCIIQFAVFKSDFMFLFAY